MRSSCGISADSDTRRGAAWRLRHDTLVFVDGNGLGHFGSRPRRITDRALARALSFRLDHRLAAGRSPESGRLLAARAQHLVSAARRQALADDWEYLLHVVRHAPAPTLGRMALRRDQIVAAEPEVRKIAACLRTPLPVAAAGVAAANVLLTDGAGPLHNPHAQVALRDALRTAITQLDPSVSLFASS
jgi:hypothetical protein